jgi:glucose/arabinose dehydrogenase
MRLSGLGRTLLPAIAALGALFVGSSLASDQSGSTPGAETRSQACPSDDSGLTLPAGFCATVFADDIGHSRHLVVAPSGVVYVNTWSGDYYPPNDKPPAGGFLVALQDTKGAGKADVNERFGETVQSGGAGGTGIALYKGSIYAEINDRIVRYSLPAGSIVPQGPPLTVVSGLPLGGDHPMHPFVIDKGFLYVDVGTATNSCQLKNRTLKSPGANPCTELETRGGIWRYDANKTNQIFSPADRFATGIRNGEGFGIDVTGNRIFVTQHGRDQLHSNWPDLYKPDQEATLPG